MINATRIACSMLAVTLSAAPLAATTAAVQGGAALTTNQAVPAAPGYADLADLVLAAPVIADATIRSANRIKGADAAGVATGRVRFYIEADVTALVRGMGGIPPRIGYLYDAVPDVRGRLPKLKKMRVLLFAQPVRGTPDQVQLVTPDAQLGWSLPLDSRIRGIVQEIVAADAAPAIVGVGNAFHVPGALPGEGETQIFLTTPDGRPVSLSILRRPGEQPRWAVALSEIVDEAAGPPRRDTLLWYRLACGLPTALPDRATASLEPANADVAREDYRFVLAALGPCGRRGS